MCDVLFSKEDGSCIWFDESDHHVKGSCFPSAIRPKNPHYLSRRNFERQFIDNLSIAVGFNKVGNNKFLRDWKRIT